MDENLRQRLNDKLLERNLSNNVNTLDINKNSLVLQEEYIPIQHNFSVLEEIVTDPSKLALIILCGVTLYALYVLSKNNKQ